MHTVFVPPLLCSARVWEGVIPAAWSFGSVSIADTRRDDSMAAMARRLLDSAPPTFVLAGASMGGYLALEVMREAPERVSGLALICTSARPDSPEQLAARPQQSRLAADGGFDTLVDAAFRPLVAPEHENDGRLLDLWRVMAGEVGLDAFLVQHEAVKARADSRALLAGIRCPTLVVHGTGDRLIAPDNAVEIADLVPNAELRLIDGAGHFILCEQPQQVAAAFSEWAAPVANAQGSLLRISAGTAGMSSGTEPLRRERVA